MSSRCNTISTVVTNQQRFISDSIVPRKHILLMGWGANTHVGHNQLTFRTQINTGLLIQASTINILFSSNIKTLLSDIDMDLVITPGYGTNFQPSFDGNTLREGFTKR